MNPTFLEQSQRLADLLVFVKVVDLGGFTAAATALALGKSTVTKQIQRLERGLAVTLLHRTTRRVTVTEAGQLLYAHAASMVRAAGDASDALSLLAARPTGRLRMTASVTYGKHVLAPLLPHFHRQYPGVQVDLLLVNRFVDLWEEGLDLAIRLTDEPPVQMAGRPVHRFDFVLCASPRFLRRHRITHPDQLKDLPCLPFGVSQPGQAMTWGFDGPGQEVFSVNVTGPVIVNSSDVVKDLLLADMGLGLLPRFAVAPDLEAGRLRSVLKPWQPKPAFGATAWALWQPQRVVPSKLRAMVDFLVEQLA